MSHPRRNSLIRVDQVAVCLIGFRHRVPRYMGDNEGAWPVAVAATKDMPKLLDRKDLEQPIHALTVHGFVWCPTEVHAKRLKETLDDVLLGQPDGAALRYGWRDLSDPQIAWPIVLNDALARLREFWPEFEVRS